MTSTDTVLLAAYAAVLIGLSPLLGRALWRVLDGPGDALPRVLRPVDMSVIRLCGPAAMRQQTAPEYLLAALTVNGLGLTALMAILLLQGQLPLNPQHLPGLPWHLAFNVAVSFVTNTNWQSYGGEATLSYFSQMAGLGVQNFLSAATGIAVLLALLRGFTRAGTRELGNFYADTLRAVVYVLLPMALAFSLVLVAQGVPQNFSPYVSAQTLEGAHQLIAQGPVASQEAIKMLGTNGGGFFNANSAHPYENPTPFTNFLQLWSILLIAAALVFTFGEAVRDRRQAWALFWAMALPFAVCVGLGLWAEWCGNPFAIAAGIDPSAGNLEGKEVRFGVTSSVLWSAATTAASNGSVNAMHESFTPLGGLVPMVLMQLGEVVFGGVGSGLYGMLLFALLTVFIAGLMVGRTPEYLGKKIEAAQMKWVVVGALLVMPLGILVIGGIAIALPEARSGLLASGPHGLSEMLYAYTSASANNGSAFAGFTANTPLHNLLLATAMLLGRYGPIVAVLSIAGQLAAKKSVPVSAGTFPTHGALFVGLLIGVIVIVGALTYFPVLALGPLAEQVSIGAGAQW